MHLNSAVALVTGGSGGLGSRICAALAAEGAGVAVGYLHGQDRADTVCKSVKALGQSAAAVSIDQADASSISAAVADVVERLGSLDILVNNAAMASGGHDLPLGDLDAFTPEI